MEEIRYTYPVSPLFSLLFFTEAGLASVKRQTELPRDDVVERSAIRVVSAFLSSSILKGVVPLI